MKKAWDDVKSFITIMSTIVYLTCIILQINIPEYFRTIYLMEISFYFGTQVEKIKQLKEELQNKNNDVG